MTNGLSFDPNTRHTGLARWVDGDVRRADTLVIDAPPPGWTRADAMAAAIIDVIRGADVEWVAVEGTYVGPNARVASDLIGLVAAVRVACRMDGLDYYEPSTTQIDSACGLRYEKGQRKAATRAFAVGYMHGFDELDEHQGDAIVVGATALAIMKTKAWEAQG